MRKSLLNLNFNNWVVVVWLVGRMVVVLKNGCGLIAKKTLTNSSFFVIIFLL